MGKDEITLYKKLDSILKVYGKSTFIMNEEVVEYVDDRVIIRKKKTLNQYHFDIQYSDGSPAFTLRRNSFALDPEMLSYIDMLNENAQKDILLRKSIIEEVHKRITMANEIADALYNILFHLNGHFVDSYEDDILRIKSFTRDENDNEFGQGICGYEVYLSNGSLVYKATNHYIRDYYDIAEYKRGSWEKHVLYLGKESNKNYETQLYMDYVRARIKEDHGKM